MLAPELTVAVNVTTVSAGTVVTGRPLAVTDNVVVVADAAHAGIVPNATTARARKIICTADRRRHSMTERLTMWCESIDAVFEDIGFQLLLFLMRLYSSSIFS
jgi:hypothetical protein